MPPARTDVTVVLVTHRAVAFLDECLDGLAEQTHPHRLLVIDNHSTDGTADILARRVPADDVHRVIRLDENTGFAGAVAAALPQVTTRFVAVLNDDAVPAPGWLAELVAVAERDAEAAAWSSLMVFADRPGTVNNFGATLDTHWYGVDVDAGLPVRGVHGGVRDVFSFCGGAALLRTAAVRAVGGFPAEFVLYYEDLDTSWRLRMAGWQIRAVPAARATHRHAATTDRTSERFHYYNERNRLLTLIRCAPLPVAPIQFARFLLTTASLAIRPARERPNPAPPNFDPRLRLRVAAAVARMAPAAYRRRAAATVPTRGPRSATVPTRGPRPAPNDPSGERPGEPISGPPTRRAS